MNKPAEIVLAISDTQYPFAHRDHLEFLKAVKKKYRPTQVVHIGDECFPGDAEVLTESGWIAFKDLVPGVKVAQYTNSGSIEFVFPLRGIIKSYTGLMVHREVGNYRSCTTEKHNLILQDRNKILRKQHAGDFSNAHLYIPRAGFHDGPGLPLSDDQIRLAVALSADFTWNPNGSIRGVLTKDRKKRAIEVLLTKLGVRFSANPVAEQPSSVSYYIGINQGLEFCTKKFSISWLSEMTQAQKRVFLNELKYWDGHKDPNRNRDIYCSSIHHNIDFVQTLAHLCGCEASVRTVYSEFGESEQVSILWSKTGTRAKTHNSVWEVKDKLVYCVTVPSGMILVRQENSITVSGNCDFHAISDYDHDPDGRSPGDEFKEAMKDMERLYEVFPVVKACISNHTARPYRRAFKYGIPRTFMKEYKELLHAPEGWNWADKWEIDGVRYEHGEGTAGKYAHIKAAGDNMQSTVMGHLHSNAGIGYIANPRFLVFGMALGCLMDKDAYAAAYAIHLKAKPILGCGIINKAIPTYIPMLLEKGGRWTGEL